MLQSFFNLALGTSITTFHKTLENNCIAITLEEFPKNKYSTFRKFFYFHRQFYVLTQNGKMTWLMPIQRVKYNGGTW